MNATELGVLLAGISSILGVIVYFTKNIKQSSCCGSECRQVVVDKDGVVLSRAARGTMVLPTLPKSAII